MPQTVKHHLRSFLEGHDGHLSAVVGIALWCALLDLSRIIRNTVCVKVSGARSRPLRVLCLHGFRTTGSILQYVTICNDKHIMEILSNQNNTWNRFQARDYMNVFKDQVDFDFIDAPLVATGK